ncbi:AsmA-like C-terminal region-containing protein [Maricaulis sp.]|uniref:YhdP family protein n=1 Tax=Maricaulis sp. TaxID=1486257 RepID=UPI0025BD4113|nr:AsmA-like C-terminal region-containing protein [Maricaulis sp.]
MLRKSVKWTLIYLLEAVAALLALTIFAIGFVLWRLSSGPVELEFLREDAQAMLASAFEGELVALGALQARFEPSSRTIVLVATDVTVAESSGEIVTRAPRIEAGLAADALIFGRIEPVELTIDGGSVSIVRRADGAVGAGLGGVERVAATARQPARGGDDSASLFEILSGPDAPTQLGRLRRVNVSNAAVRVVDDVVGLAWFVDSAGVIIDRDDARILTEINGRLATPSGFAPVYLRLRAGSNLESLLLEARFQGLSPAGILPDTGPMAALRALDAPIDLNLVVDATRDNGIRTASLQLDVGAGRILVDGAMHAFEGANLYASFDPVQQELTLHSGRVRSDLFAASIEGRLTEIGGYDGALPSRARFNLAIGEGFVDIGPVFERAPEWESLAASGEIRLDEFAVILDRLDLEIDTIRAELSGGLQLEQRPDGSWLPNLQLDGPILGDVEPQTVLAYWPVEMADGGRDWVSEGILGGRFYNARFFLDLPASAIAEGQLDNDRMRLSFDFENAHVRYITTMTPITEGRGSATLRGNSFEVRMESGRIGDLEISEGFVDLPRLNPKGAVARYGGLARGRASDILALIDEDPLFLVSDYGLDPALIGGEGEMRFEIHRAMLTEVDPEDIPFFITGRFSNASLDVPGTDYALSEGEVEINASQDGLQARGDASLFGAPVRIDWRESFGLSDDAPSTRIGLETVINARTLDRFNMPARRFFDGSIRIAAEAVSDGLDFRSVSIEADLLDALIEAPGGLWTKEAGAPGRASLNLARRADGGFDVGNIQIAADGAGLEAAALIGPTGGLEDVTVERLFVDGLMDLSGQVTPALTPGEPLRVRLAGQYADISSVVPYITSAGGEGGITLPLSMQVDVGRLILSESSVLDQFNLIWRSEAAGIRAVSLSGNATDGPFQASFGASEAGGQRDFRIEAQSLERISALIGIEGYARGGQVSVLGSAPPLGTDGPLTARVEVRDLTLVRVPVLARILAAGSFQGLGALLNGEGISFDAVDADIAYEDGLLTIGDGRARGSALGVTGAGTIDFADSHAAIDGNLAPSYVINSLFGGLPVIGEVLVSRPGEGVIGITYSVEGPFDSLTVFANPLSALAPGVFRRMFEGTAAERAARDRAREDDAATIPSDPETMPETGPDSGPDPEPDPVGPDPDGN